SCSNEQETAHFKLFSPAAYRLLLPGQARVVDGSARFRSRSAAKSVSPVGKNLAFATPGGHSLVHQRSAVRRPLTSSRWAERGKPASGGPVAKVFSRCRMARVLRHRKQDTLSSSQRLTGVARIPHR